MHRLVAVTGLVAVLLTGCGSGSTGADPARTRLVRVTAAENTWGNIAAQIGGSHVAVTSIITSPDLDPHTYQVTPKSAVQIGTADLVIENGLDYDAFVGRVLASDPRPTRRVVDVATVLGVRGAGANPHLWYWTSQLPRVAAAIAAQLSALDPADRKSFQAGARRFDASLTPVRRVIAAVRQQFAGAPVAYTERLPGYLLSAAGLRVVTPAGFAAALENGTDPSPQDVAAFDRDLTGRRVRVLLCNSQVVDPAAQHAKGLATRSGVPVVGMAELLPPSAASFQAWQLEQDRQLLAALRR